MRINDTNNYKSICLIISLFKYFRLIQIDLG